MLLGFAALPIRGLLFATVSEPYLLVAVQLLDGLTAAVLGVMVPLMVADLTRGSGRFNSAQGIVGMMIGIGASGSPTLAGYLDRSRRQPRRRFFGLTAIAVAAFVAVLVSDARDAAAARVTAIISFAPSPRG